MRSGILVLVVCSIVAAIVGSPAPVQAADPAGANAKSALQKHAYPWYDTSRDAFRPMRPTEVERPSSAANDFKLFSGAIPFGQIVLWMVLGIIVALLVAAIAKGLSNVEPPAIKDHRQLPAVNVERLEALPESTRGVHDLLGEAARLAAQGAYGPALTFYHSWQLLQLDKQGLLELQKGKTNRRYIAEVVQSKSSLIDLFRNSTRLVEDAFFGHLPVSREQFEFVWNQQSSFRESERRTLS